jgi:hypothetical protein
MGDKASSGLALKPTDLSALLTEQIAHLRPLMCQAWFIGSTWSRRPRHVRLPPVATPTIDSIPNWPV